jgi:hypothetical protein
MLWNEVAEIRVHPALAIARLGNSPDEFYLAPEAPGQIPNEGRPYKDAQGRVKREAARFRLFAYAKDGTVLGEVTAADAEIKWTVHLANKKGAWWRFQSRFSDPATRALRNRWKQDGDSYAADPDLRTELIIDPGPKALSHGAADRVRLTGGEFAGVKVDLGEIRVESTGRLLVLGGLGRSGTAVEDKPISTYANNDYWFDDTSDGPIAAEIIDPDGRTISALPAHVIVAPPKFTPGHENLVSLLDVVAPASGAVPTRLGDDETVDFHRDIEPILRRIADYTWVSARADVGHAPGMGADFGNQVWVAKLGDPSQPAAMRKAVFGRIRVPAEIDAAKNKRQAHLKFMPPLSGDGGDAIDGDALTPEVPPEQTWMTVTARQYDMLARWAEGKFITGTPIAYRPLDAFPLADQPAALDRAPLQASVGGPFYPGIEMTYIAADPATWAAPLRLAASFSAGDVTRWMAVPWQADFFECMLHWWPAARPDDVLPVSALENFLDGPDQDDNRAIDALAQRLPWTRGLPKDSPAGDNAMAAYWSELGFVVPHKAQSGERYFVEQERAAIVGMNDCDLFYQLMNVEDFPDVVAKARSVADYWLAKAEQISNDPSTARADRFFAYSPDALQNRLDQIYRELVHSAAASDPASNKLFKTRDDLIQRIRQLAPFNLTDGCWLRNIGKTGPIDEVRSLLISVLMDELGDGEVAQNHCNIYRDLCHSVGLYLPDVRSADFVYDQQFLDSAFTLPAFELAISQFSDEYFPELLGMTLYLEWGVVESKGTRDLFDYHGVDAHFYIMHIGIDNAVNGHGQRAAEAVRLYLTGIRASGGDVAVAQAWRRIWNGYVAFGYTGRVGADLIDLIQHPPSLRNRLIDLIERKAIYGQYNHENHMIGDNKINAWFQDPEGFLDALVANDYLAAGDWEGSKLFKLLDFETGPMYRVFTPDEIELWAAYTRSLADQAAPPVPAPQSVTDPGQQMAAVIDRLRPQQAGAIGHARHTLFDASGAAHPIGWWFDQPSPQLMAALADPANAVIVPGDAGASTFVNEWIASSAPMGDVFDQRLAGTGSPSCREATIAWINADCPIPALGERLFLAPRLADFAESVVAPAPRRVHGMGTVH